MDTRHCARPSCSAPAAATMSYDYSSRTVWLYRPGEEPGPGTLLGLCATHADSLRVPLGWAAEDRRPPAAVLHPPLAS